MLGLSAAFLRNRAFGCIIQLTLKKVARSCSKKYFSKHCYFGKSLSLYFEADFVLLTCLFLFYCSAGLFFVLFLAMKTACGRLKNWMG